MSKDQDPKRKILDILSFINLLHIYIYANFTQDTESPPQTLSLTILSLLAISTVAIFSLTHINLRNSFLRGFPLPFNVETLQAFGALFQNPHYWKFLHCKLKMLCNYVFLMRHNYIIIQNKWHRGRRWKFKFTMAARPLLIIP
jgi:hypothetical protein